MKNTNVYVYTILVFNVQQTSMAIFVVEICDRSINLGQILSFLSVKTSKQFLIKFCKVKSIETLNFVKVQNVLRVPLQIHYHRGHR